MGPRPSTSVSLIFGAELPLSKLHLNPGIHITVTSFKAMNDLQGLSDDRVKSLSLGSVAFKFYIVMTFFVLGDFRVIL